MKQLGGLDNLMIQGELPNIPMHMSAVMIYDTAGMSGSVRLWEALKDRLERVIETHFPILRCRLESLPLDLDKGYWVEDPDFRLTYHVSSVALPKRRDWQALYRLFSQFHAQPLDRSRPLWQVMYVEGLEELEGVPPGSSALFLKIHHAVMDGKSAQRLMSSFHSLSAEPGSATIADSWAAEDSADKDFRQPSLLAKYGRAWWHSIERPFDLVGTLARLLPGLLQGDGADGKEKARPIPQLRFNHPVAHDRVVGHVRMGMDQLKRLEEKYRCTINDIALCVIAGGLRDFLLANGELPEETLQVFMPIDVRREGKDGSMGNHVTMAKLPLHTGMADKREQLLAIHADASRHKHKTSKKNAHAMLGLVDDIHPVIILWLGRWLVNSGHIDELPLAANSIVTNVPGLPSAAYVEGIKLIDYLGFGPLAPNMGLFHTVSSTEDHVNASFLSTAEFLDDGAEYRRSLANSWDAISHL